MKFPDRPTVHGDTTLGGEARWRPAATEIAKPGYGWDPFRTCWYCGSMHPEDALCLLRDRGGSLHGSDWKYGWPHKFYLEGFPNPFAGQRESTGGSSGPCDCTRDGVASHLGVASHARPDCPRCSGAGRFSEVHWGESPATKGGKFYSEHLLDEGLDDEARAALVEVLARHSGIEFAVEGGKLRYRAPCHGYQR